MNTLGDIQEHVDHIDLEQFMMAFSFLARKPLSFIYQDILDRLYIASKQLNLSIIGFTMINHEEDVELKEVMIHS
jgi:hypothetical protein